MEALHDILVAVDFSDGCSAALRQARRIARWNGARLHVLHVIDALVVTEMSELLPGGNEAARIKIVKDARHHLASWMRDCLGDDSVDSISIEIGATVDEMIRTVRQLKVDLLVLGVRGAARGTGAGTVATKAIRKAPTKVLLVHPGQREPFRCVVAGVDFSETAQVAATQAARVALIEDAELHLLHVYSPPWKVLHYLAPTPEASPDFQTQYKDALQGRLQAVLRKAREDTTAELEARCALHEARTHGCGIVEYAQEVRADLIAVGTRGRTNLRYVFLGSTAERVLKDLDVSLLALKPPARSIDHDE